MKRREALIADLVTPTVEALGLELWGVEQVSQGKFSLLRLYIDRAEGGVTVDDCERVSHQVSALFDVEDPIPGEYTLEVSSPGLDRPLFTLAQFKRYVGETVKLRTQGPIDGRRKFKGMIVEIVDDSVVMNVDGVDFTIPHGDIEKAGLVTEL